MAIVRGHGETSLRRRTRLPRSTGLTDISTWLNNAFQPRFLIVVLTWVTGLIVPYVAIGASLIHRYSFNDGTANDSVGKAHGRSLGGVTISNGQAYFTGKCGQRVELLANGPAGININTLKAMTLEIWYTIEQPAPWQFIFDFGSSSGLGIPHSFGGRYILYAARSVLNDSRAVLSTANPGARSEAVASGYVVPSLKEQYAAVVVNSETISLYLNGHQIAQTPVGHRKLDQISTDFALLGASLWGSDPTMIGSINEFRIYNIAASDSQIARSFAAGPDSISIN